jgi:2-methylisocitrate lyase-like PEP mutase family enzyme
VALTVTAVLDAGAVGMTLEDATPERARALLTVQEQVDRIREARRTAESRGVPLVINARTDLFLLAEDPGIEALAKAVRGPLNVLAGTGTPRVAELLGVARLSVGSGHLRATMAFTRRIARELREAGTYTQITGDTLPYAAVNQLMDRNSS